MMDPDLKDILLATVAAFTAGGLYVVPGVVARLRKHRDALWIAVLNVVLGWSILGWFGALGWALFPAKATPPGSRATVPVLVAGFLAVFAAMWIAVYLALVMLGMGTKEGPFLLLIPDGAIPAQGAAPMYRAHAWKEFG